LFWNPEDRRRVGRPLFTLNIIQNETGFNETLLTTAMQDREYWRRNFVLVSSTSVDDYK